MRHIIAILALLLTSNVLCAESWVNEADMLDEISGTVVDQTGNTISGAILQWQNADLFMPNLHSLPIKADKNGKFRFPVNMQSVHGRVLCVSNPDGAMSNEYYIGEDEKLMELDHRNLRDDSWIHNVEYTVYPTRWIAGVVHDTKGNPVQGASVYSPFSASLANVVQTDENGIFTVAYPRYPKDTFYFTIFKPGVGIAIVDLSNRVFSGQSMIVNGKESPYKLPDPVVLSKPFGPVKVQIVDHAGQPVPSIAVAHFNTPIDLPENENNTTKQRVADIANLNSAFTELYPFFQRTNENGFAVINVPYPEDLSHTTLSTVAAPFYISCKVDAKNWTRDEDDVIRITATDVLSVRGTIEYPDGKPASKVRLAGKICGHDVPGNSQRFSYATTDSQGRYELPINPLESLRPIDPEMYKHIGNVHFGFSVLGESWTAPAAYVTIRRDATGRSFPELPPDDAALRPRTNSPKDNRSTVRNFTLCESAAITGKVLHENNPDAPINDAVVLLEQIMGQNDATEFVFAQASVLSDKEGEYAFQISPGKYRISLYYPINRGGGLQGAPVTIAGQNGIHVRDETEPFIINITESKHYVHNIDSAFSNGLICRGVLVSSDDAPVADETVHITRLSVAGNGRVGPLRSILNVSAKTDKDGEFRFRIPAKNNQAAIATIINTTTRDESACAIAVLDDDTIKTPAELVLRPTRTLTGRLLDSQTNKPYVNHKVMIDGSLCNPSFISIIESLGDDASSWDSGNTYRTETRTDENGCFTFSKLPDFLTYRLMVSNIIPEQFAHLKIGNERNIVAGTIDFTLLDEDGKLDDVYIPAASVQPLPTDYISYLNQDTRPFSEKFDEAKLKATKENKRIVAMMRYSGSPDYWERERQFVEIFFSDAVERDFVLLAIRNTPSGTDNGYSNDTIAAFNEFGIAENERNRPMLCLLNANGEVIRKAPFFTLMQSDDEWEKFFANQ